MSILKVVPVFLPGNDVVGDICINTNEYKYIALTLPDTPIVKGDTFIQSRRNNIILCHIARFTLPQKKILAVSRKFFTTDTRPYIHKIPAISKESIQDLVDYYNKYDKLPDEVQIEYTATAKRAHICFLNKEATVDILTTY